MTELARLRKRRAEILVELGGLEEMRRGSVVEQYVVGERKDGTRSKRGPYLLYSYKDKGRTVSRRVRDPEEAAVYREQIQRFRRFRKLTEQLLAIGEEISESALSGGAVKKT